MVYIFAAGKVIVGLAILESLLIIGTQSFLIGISNDYNDVTKYAIISVLSIVGLLFFVIHGIVKENIFEVFAFGACSIMVVITTIFQLINVLDSNITIAPIVVQLIVVLLFPIIYGTLGWQIYLEIRFRILMRFQDNSVMQEIYTYYQIFLTGLKFDTQLNAILLVIQILFVFGSGWSVYILIPAFVIFTFGGAIVAYYGARREDKRIMWLFMLVLIPQPIYLLYKEIKLTAFGADPDEQFDAATSTKLAFYWITGMVGLVVRLGLMYVVWRVHNNFGKGLKDKLSKNKESLRMTQTSRAAGSIPTL